MVSCYFFFFSLVTFFFFFAVTTSTQRHKSRNTNIQESQDLKSKQLWDLEYSYSTLATYDIAFRSSEKSIYSLKAHPHIQQAMVFQKPANKFSSGVNSTFQNVFKIRFIFIFRFSLSHSVCVYIHVCTSCKTGKAF